MNFLTEAAPAHDAALPVAPGIRRVVAPNPGPMTYHGTNSYLLDWPDGVAVVDPGPDDAVHVGRLVTLAGAPIRAILLTHGHRDHWGGLSALRATTGATLHAHRDSAHAPEHRLGDGSMAGAWQALDTPGHAPDHVSFYGPDGIVLSGDHVMGWSSTVVGGEGGDMAAYVASLRRMLARPARLFLPGHGPAIAEPLAYAAELLAHREAREAQLLTALAAGPQSTDALVRRLYPVLDPKLHGAARANVGAHLAKLAGEGRAVEADAVWRMIPDRGPLPSEGGGVPDGL